MQFPRRQPEVADPRDDGRSVPSPRLRVALELLSNDPDLVCWDKFGRPQREAEATYLSPFPDGWWHGPVKADRIENADDQQ